MADLGKLYRCTLCRHLRDADAPTACKAKGDRCGFVTGAVENVDATPGAIKAMWRQNNASSVGALTWAIVGISVVLIGLAGIRMMGG